MDLNKVILIGNVGGDPEFHEMQAGGKLAKFSVATTRKWKDRNSGDRKEDTTWHNIVIFDPYIVDVVEKYVRKGTKVYLEGELKKRSYEKDGEKQWISEIVLPQIRGLLILLGKQRNDGQSSDAPPAGSSTPPPASDDFDDDIPF